MRIELTLNARDEYNYKLIKQAYECKHVEETIKLTFEQLANTLHGYRIIENDKILCELCKSTGYTSEEVICSRCKGVGRYPKQ